jgi:hypothetical protein
VDAESLKKARQRIDKRLKERLAAQNKDSRRDKTLELARQLASEGVRQRQEQWEKQQTAIRERDDSRTDSSTESTIAVDSSEGKPDASENMNEASDVNAPTDGMMAQQDSDATSPATDHTKNILAKAMEKQQKTASFDDKKRDAVNTSDDSSEIPDMKTESESYIKKSWFIPSRKESDAALSASTSDSRTDPEDQSQTIDALTESGRSHQRERWRWIPGGGLARLLPLVAWLILVTGISGAILSWTTLTVAEADVQAQQVGIGNSVNLGLLLGFAYLATGVLGFAFFWVSSLISRQLKDIRQLLLLQPIPRSESMVAQSVPAPEQTQ